MQPRRPKKKSFNSPPQMGKQHNAKCRRCGRESHLVQQCPAKNEICRRYNCKGHFAKQCLSKTVAMVSYCDETSESESTEEEPDKFCLGTTYLNAVGGDSNAWKIKLNVEDQPLPFKIDTGAEVTTISESAWKSLRNRPTLAKTTKNLDRTEWKYLLVKFVVIKCNSDHEQRLERICKHKRQIILEYRLDRNQELLRILPTTLVIAKEGRCGVNCD